MFTSNLNEMGSCVCKERIDCSGSIEPRGNSIDDPYAPTPRHRTSDGSVYEISRSQIDALILHTLKIIRKLIDNNEEPPSSMLKLHVIAEQENGWLSIIDSLLHVVPFEDPLGPAVITLILDECPLPTKESIELLLDQLSVSLYMNEEKSSNVCYYRNAFIILGFLAEKMAGPCSIILFNDKILHFLLSNLNSDVNPSVILFSLIALEKFCQTSENKSTVSHWFEMDNHKHLLMLETWKDCDDSIKRQVGFSAQWCLDNFFFKKCRLSTYLTVDRSNLNAMLNCNDVSEYLKISADGLTARSDASSFESVRCTFPVSAGQWYYEVTVITSGVMQIGWATKDSKFMNHDGYGIGDDEFSIAYDGCRQLIWYNACSQPHSHPCWKPGDVLGTVLDMEKERIYFYLNGRSLPHFYKDVFKSRKSEFFAAASFMSFQHCEFNFGSMKFKFPPKKIKFCAFNDHASLTDQEKIILPRYLQLQLLKTTQVKQDSCSICFDRKSSVKLLPCEHSGFCMECAFLLEQCPMCRLQIEERLDDM